MASEKKIVLSENESEEEVEESHGEPLMKIWNLRPRNLITKKQPFNDFKNKVTRNSLKIGTNAHGSAHGSGQENNKLKFSVSLTKSEIESDFIAMTGFKPSKKPIHKRNKSLQKKIDYIYPSGKRLSTINLDAVNNANEDPDIPLKK